MAQIFAQAPFQFDPQLTAVANMAFNEMMIADRVLPRVPLNQETFKYLEIPRGENFTIPETLIGREGDPNEVHFTGKEQTGSVEGHALTTKVPLTDQEQQQLNYDPRARGVTGISELLLLRKEKDMADVVFEATNYAAGQTETLAGADQWSNTSSNPLRKIRETMDTMIMRPNIMVVGREVATQLILHPVIVSAFHRNEGDNGVVSLGFLADILGLEEVLVGEAWYNENQLGQDVSLARVWGKRAALLHRSSRAVPDPNGFLSILSFGVHFTWPIDNRDLAAGSWMDPKPGTRGVEWLKAAMRYSQTIIASDFGYLFIDAVE